MKIVLAVIGGLVALVLLVVAIGWSLPERHRASRQATYAAPPERVYEAITNVEAYPLWRSTVDSVAIVEAPGGKRGFRESGGDGTILYVIEEAVPSRRVVTRIADQSLPFGGSWTYELAPAAGGTTLRITEDGEVYNPIYRFVSRFVLGHHATIDGYLDDLGKRLGGAVRISG